MKKTLLIIIAVLIVAGLGIIWQLKSKQSVKVSGENIGNELEKQDLIRLTNPQPNDIIKSPLVITGEARGSWFFEASFPVILTDWDGLIIAQGVAKAQSEWMTEDFVPFTATLLFKNPAYPKNKNNGSLILKKDNPSGLPAHNDALEISILFGQ